MSLKFSHILGHIFCLNFFDISEWDSIFWRLTGTSHSKKRYIFANFDPFWTILCTQTSNILSLSFTIDFRKKAVFRLIHKDSHSLISSLFPTENLHRNILKQFLVYVQTLQMSRNNLISKIDGYICMYILWSYLFMVFRHTYTRTLHTLDSWYLNHPVP